MAYNADKTWDALVNDIQPPALALLTAIREGKAAYSEWQSVRDNRTDADIATALTALGRPTSTAEVAVMDSAFSALDSIMRYLDNDTPPAGIDQGFALRVFS